MTEIINKNTERPVDIILLDLGGVLVELTGVPVMQRWVGGGISPEGIWEKWLKSETVRRFETGVSPADEFASSMVDEFSLPVTPEKFLSEFVSWPVGLYPGVVELLTELNRNYITASFSNTNPLHWERFTNEMGVDKLFARNFPSHLIGVLKPDRAAYENVIREREVSPQKILFLDDNQLNVDPARDIGMQAYRVSGINGVTKLLTELGINY